MAAETEGFHNVASSGSKKKGILRHFRFRKNRGTTDDAALSKAVRNESPTTLEETADSPTPFENVKDSETPSQMRTVRFPAKDALKKATTRSRRELTKPPPAREAAFGGPPRYDWIDIVSSSGVPSCLSFAVISWRSCPVAMVNLAKRRERRNFGDAPSKISYVARLSLCI
jgi:hypothetical protein